MENLGTDTTTKPKNETPILQLHRLNYVTVSGKILDSSSDKLDQYIKYASERLKTQISKGDCLEHALKLLFERDIGFKEWLKNT